jgi:hypothetical protein
MVRRAWVVARAQAAAWRGAVRRSRRTITSAVLVAAGMCGAPLAGLLVGLWFTGLILVAESAGCVWFGLMRETGPVTARRGRRTVGQALEDHDAAGWPL